MYVSLTFLLRPTCVAMVVKRIRCVAFVDNKHFVTLRVGRQSLNSVCVPVIPVKLT